MNDRRAVVVGAGIGGLTAAVALCRQGWDVRVLERAEALEPVGAGLAVAPNALRVLDLFGAGRGVRALAVESDEGGIRRHDGRWLARTSTRAVTTRLGVPFVVARRSDLVEILTDLLPDGVLSLGQRVVHVAVGDANRPAVVTTSTGGGLEAELVVSADGIHSGTRGAVFPGRPEPRYSGATTWRFIGRAEGDCWPGETWGRGRVFGIQPLADGQVYCYASAYAAAGGRADDEAALLRELFAGWHRPIPQLLLGTSAGEVLRSDVYEIGGRLPAFHAGRVALLGDAAHAVTPNLGQGACQAIEDAAVLAYLVGDSGAGVPAALAGYSATRRPRTRRIAGQSRRMMRLSHLSARPVMAARDAMMAAARLLSTDTTARMFFGVAGWRPPQEVSAEATAAGRDTGVN